MSETSVQLIGIGGSSIEQCNFDFDSATEKFIDIDLDLADLKHIISGFDRNEDSFCELENKSVLNIQETKAAFIKARRMIEVRTLQAGADYHKLPVRKRAGDRLSFLERIETSFLNQEKRIPFNISQCSSHEQFSMMRMINWSLSKEELLNIVKNGSDEKCIFSLPIPTGVKTDNYNDFFYFHLYFKVSHSIMAEAFAERYDEFVEANEKFPEYYGYHKIMSAVAERAQ